MKACSRCARTTRSCPFARKLPEACLSPHPPCEIVVGSEPLHVVDANGIDRTAAFLEGARKTLETVQATNCRTAILKAKSPSCGTGRVYDGTFTGTLVDGFGVAARLLQESGIRVLDENQVGSL